MNTDDFKIIADKSLFPIVPLVNNNKITYAKWSNEKDYIKNNKELNNFLSLQQNRNATGFSLLTGNKSSIIVIDLDKNHGDGLIDGEKSFFELIKDLSEVDKQQIADTFTVKTPNGGSHLYFKYRDGLKNKANYAPGVDVRTDGGLIVLPGSKSRVNEEIREYTVIKNNDINEMPQALFDIFSKLDKHNKRKAEPKTLSPLVSINYGEGARNQELFKEVIGIVSKSSIRDIATIYSIARGLNLLKCNPPLEDEEVSNIVASISQRLYPPYCNSKGNIELYELTNHILGKTPCYTKGNLWFIFDNKEGVYKYMEFKEVQKMYFKYPINNSDKTVVKSKNFAELLMLNSEDAKEVHDEKKYINCKNGIVDIERNILLKHDPKYKTEVQFQANLIEDSEEFRNLLDKSEFKKFLNDLLDESSIKTLQEGMGLMLSPHAKETQNCFIYKGEGSNGKSSVFDIQEALINDNKHICSIGLGDFGGDFTISAAEGKHVNIVRDDELSVKTVNKTFKSMVCGEPVTVNRKNKDLVRLGFNMTMFFGLNRLPSAADKSTGFFRRPIIIPFNTSFGTQKEVEEGARDKLKDPLITDRIIKNELDIVLTWAYEGLKRVKNNNWKVTVSKAAEEEMEEYREEVDSAYAFFKEKIALVAKKNIKIPKGDVYKVYENWCISNSIASMNKTHFGRQLSSFGVKSIKSNGVGYYLDIEVDELILIEDKQEIF
ncbi:phage/plasmid primase, P4 family [Clostridium beijerinckii]|uniref:phage/plasmid primase, P4 family n=1 Tax=Clostridium beijerinckii TaxID=1520 RepID=UPI00047E49BA|nr:phage/plasmid primase, P4 family [Clostridium beijerinckii]